MPLETATFVGDLNPANPAHGDGLDQADSHLRLLKAVLQAQFTSLGSAAVTASAAQLNRLNGGTLAQGDGTSSTPAYGYAADATTGFYRSAAGRQSIIGKLAGNGAVPVCSIVMFPTDLGTAVIARGGVATGSEPYVEMDGAAYNVATFPDLGAIINPSGSSFLVPNVKDTGRFLRSRYSGLGVGGTQSNQNAAHAHTYTGGTSTDGDHTHSINNSFTGITAGATTNAVALQPSGSAGTGGGNVANLAATVTVTISDGGHAHTANNAGAHGHTCSGNTSNVGGTEARPESFAVVMCLKT